MSVQLKSGPGIRMSSIARPAVVRPRAALVAAHAHLAGLRADPAARAEAIERTYARRAVWYVALNTVLLGHIAAYADKVPFSVKWLCVGCLAVGWAWWVAARRRAASGRRAAWVSWAVGCVVATSGIVVSRETASAGLLLVASLYGLATFGLGCALAADARRFYEVPATRWLFALLLVVALLMVHQALLTSWGGSGHT